MSKRLQQIVESNILMNWNGSREAFCAKAGVSYSTLAHALSQNGRYKPSRKTLVRIALACDCTEEEALKLADESAPQKARKRAS